MRSVIACPGIFDISQVANSVEMYLLKPVEFGEPDYDALPFAVGAFRAPCPEKPPERLPQWRDRLVLSGVQDGPVHVGRLVGDIVGGLS